MYIEMEKKKIWDNSYISGTTGCIDFYYKHKRLLLFFF